MTVNIESDQIFAAYICLKNHAYHENLNLFLKQRIAQFETENQLTDTSDLFNKIAKVIKSNNLENDNDFQSWIKSINYKLLPKSVQKIDSEDRSQNNQANNDPLFITNVREFDKYSVQKVNYFIDAPVELHIIEMLWCIYAGPALEATMTKDSYGNRIHSNVISQSKHPKKQDFEKQIFKRYIDQYNSWRDQSIVLVKTLLKQGDNAAILSLDLTSYFYHIDNIDFEKIKSIIQEYYSNDVNYYELPCQLTQIINLIFEAYYKKIKPDLEKTHEECKKKQGLPIGFASSAVIANWYLNVFDKKIAEKIRPAYYGRYVDDILMVFKNPKFNQDDPIKSFIENYLPCISNDKKEKGKKKLLYCINIDENTLPIQENKLILHFLDTHHSNASLEIFKQELDERSSAFKFLPSDHLDKELNQYAYDLIYKGSPNKLRSIVGLVENESGLSKYLLSHITAHRLCKVDRKDTVIEQLKHFFKGLIALEFHRLWEKIYQYGIVIDRQKFVYNFYKYINLEIKKITDTTPAKNFPIKKIQEDLIDYNNISIALSLGLLDQNLKSFLFKDYSEICSFANNFRCSNLIRHHLVAWPLSNYSSYKGDLTDENALINENFEIDENKIKLSPRFIHFDEWQIFNINKHLQENTNLYSWIKESINRYKEISFNKDFPVKLLDNNDNNNNIETQEIFIGATVKPSTIKIAIANLVVKEKNIESAVRKDEKPNTNFDRQVNLYEILNSALYEKADILVMPEVSIPVGWLPFMVSFSRRNQIGLVFGLEHWVLNDKAYNLLIEVLPFKISNKYKSCAVIARIKNHYAPAELDLLNKFRLEPGNKKLQPKAYYHKISWRGVTFASYNCFELSDIKHRSIFKSEIDLLIACVWNRDTNYYHHILESAVRDLHCYMVQTNTSQYGGSCVIRPTNTENKTMLYVKGGVNPCVLTTEINIAELRSFQFKSKPDKTDEFKHVPPGFDHAIKRLNKN